VDACCLSVAVPRWAFLPSCGGTNGGSSRRAWLAGCSSACNDIGRSQPGMDLLPVRACRQTEWNPLARPSFVLRCWPLPRGQVFGYVVGPLKSQGGRQGAGSGFGEGGGAWRLPPLLPLLTMPLFTITTATLAPPPLPGVVRVVDGRAGGRLSVCSCQSVCLLAARTAATQQGLG
jgi:hypothetical protein